MCFLPKLSWPLVLCLKPPKQQIWINVLGQFIKMIKKIRFVDGIAVVTATADFHPLRQLAQLTTDIKAYGFGGVVLFDLLAVNGLTSNRFVSMRFNSAGFDRASFEVASEINPNILKEQNLNEKNAPVFLAASVLSSSEIRQFAC